MTDCDSMDCSPPDFRPWNFPGENTGVGCHSLFQGIFPTQGWDTGDSLPPDFYCHCYLKTDNSLSHVSTNYDLHVMSRYKWTFIEIQASLFIYMLSKAVGLKLNNQKTKIMTSGPITSWQIDGKTIETVRDFILGRSKITADGDCSHEIKRLLLLGWKAMTNLDSILKSRDITLPTKVHLVKAI